MLKPPLTFLSVDELLAQPDPEWLLPDLLLEQSLAVLYGKPGNGKTFLALDWALRIASGFQWRGKDIPASRVLYVVAEGGLGFRQRVNSWLTVNTDALDNFTVLKQPVLLHDPVEVERLASALRAAKLRPRLMVFDTLAQNFVGGEENSAAEMGRWLQGARSLQEEFSSTVLILHHSTKAGHGARGSGALEGAADTMIRATKTKNGITLNCEKQKDAECFSNLRFELHKVPEARSAVVVLAGTIPTATLSAADAKLLQALADLPNGANSKQWKALTNSKERTFHRRKAELLAQGMIEQMEGGIYRVTEDGLSAIAAKTLPLPDAA